MFLKKYLIMIHEGKIAGIPNIPQYLEGQNGAAPYSFSIFLLDFPNYINQSIKSFFSCPIWGVYCHAAQRRFFPAPCLIAPLAVGAELVQIEAARWKNRF